jgi:hypothetical protein
MPEIGLSGSVRGVRSNPYPYRDTPTPDAEGGANNSTPKTGHPGAPKRHPWRGRYCAAGSPTRARIGGMIGTGTELNRAGIGQGKGHRIGAAGLAGIRQNQERG